MKVFNILIIAVVAILSIAAGLAKVMQTPQELEFLQGVGFSPALIVVFGLVQIVGGVFLALPKTRWVGAGLAALAFGLSAVLVLLSGNLVFGLISLLPVLLAGFIAYRSFTTRDSK